MSVYHLAKAMMACKEQRLVLNAVDEQIAKAFEGYAAGLIEAVKVAALFDSEYVRGAVNQMALSAKRCRELAEERISAINARVVRDDRCIK
jgi:hypothetical protein